MTETFVWIDSNDILGVYPKLSERDLKGQARTLNVAQIKW